jgi:hypothetical protein
MVGTMTDFSSKTLSPFFSDRIYTENDSTSGTETLKALLSPLPPGADLFRAADARFGSAM